MKMGPIDYKSKVHSAYLCTKLIGKKKQTKQFDKSIAGLLIGIDINCIQKINRTLKHMNNASIYS